MEWPRLLAVGLSSFSLGISLTGLVFSIINYRNATERLKRMEARRAELEKKKEELDKQLPLTPYDWETTEDFIERVQEKLTMNAARLSVGLSRIEEHEEEPKQ